MRVQLFVGNGHRVQRQSLWRSGEKLEVQSETNQSSKWRGDVDVVPILVERNVAIQLGVRWEDSKHGANVPSESQNDSGNAVHQARLSLVGWLQTEGSGERYPRQTQ